MFDRSSPIGGIAAAVALVLAAVLIGVFGNHGGSRSGTPAAVAATGHTTTVAVTAKDMRYQPNRISVPRGDRLVIVFTNRDDMRHDLTLANGAHTALLDPGRTARLDAGVIGGTVAGWCSVPGHREAGMTLTITATGAPAPAGTGGDMAGMSGMGAAASAADARYDPSAVPGPGFTARDATLPPVPAGRVHRITLRVRELVLTVAPGVRQMMWTFGGTVPGPVFHGHLGDTFVVTLINDGTMEHGIDFHAGVTGAPDVAMRSIAPGQSLVYTFTAAKAGIWMYHCSTSPMLYHMANGMYGAVVIDPPGLAPVARQYVLIQSEMYFGPQGGTGDMAKMEADAPDTVVFNGYPDQYVYRPLPARAGQRIRVWFLDAGPNRWTAFHIVGAQFDTEYVEGAWLLRPGDPGGSQVLNLSPAEGGFVETVLPSAGGYPFLDHSMVDADRGARGEFAVTG